MWACCCTGQVDKWLLFLERAGLDVALHKEEVVPIMTLLLDNLLFLQLLGGMRPSWQPCRHP